MPVPKKPNKRRSNKVKSVANPSAEPSSTDIAYQRFIQAQSLRGQIKDKMGDVFEEIKEFDESLSLWTSTGKDLNGRCSIQSMGKVLEWAFHSDIKRYPELWLREG